MPTLILLIMLFGPCQLLAQKSEVRFADIPWGADADVVRRHMAASGYKFLEVDSDGDLNFSGVTQGYRTHIFAFMSPAQGMQKVQVNIATPDNFAIQTYKKMQDVLTTKYGPPRMELHNFKYPYKEGEGDEEMAIRANKADFSTVWAPKGQNGEELGYPGLVLLITPKLAVTVSYEGPNWSEESRRREADATKAF